MAARLPDYYALLHVDPAAPAEVIRASYRALMQQLRAHPDLGGDHDSATALNVAYATLKDPVRRAEYDARRATEGIDPAAHRSTATQQSPTPDHAQRDTAERDPHTATATGIWSTDADDKQYAARCPFCGAAARAGAGVERSEECRVCAAPLAIVRSLGRDSTEMQRSVYRIAKAEALRVYLSPEDRSSVAALVHDISLSGMRFSCAAQLSAGDLIRVDCDICAAVARVAHLRHGEATTIHYGAQFLTARFKRQRGSLLSVPA